MPLLAEMNATQRNRILMRPVRINDDVPWTTPDRPVAEGTLALVTTSGLHHRDDPPFVKYDQTFRTIASDVAEGELLQSQSSIGFDRSLRIRDVNVVFPIDRLREMVDAGELGALTAEFYSLVGAQDDSEQTAAAVAAEIGPRIIAAGAQFVLLTPSCPVCTHTCAALARELESQGLATVALSLVREYTEKVRPPRAVFVPFPFGAPCGLPGEAEQQRAVLATALETFAAPEGPVIADFEAPDVEGFGPGPVQASAVERSATADLDVATETSMMRRYYEKWVEDNSRTAVGLSKIPVVRFRGIIRFFEAFVENGTGDIRERPADVPLAEFMRYCSDDLKAMYIEGRMAMKPSEGPNDAARWLWGETALGGLLVALRDRMQQSDDESIKDAAFGIAR